MAKNSALWMHRPSVKEHEALLKAMKDSDYPSVSAFVREAVLRLIYTDNPTPLFSTLRDALVRAEELTDDLIELKGGE